MCYQKNYKKITLEFINPVSKGKKYFVSKKYLPLPIAVGLVYNIMECNDDVLRNAFVPCEPSAYKMLTLCEDCYEFRIKCLLKSFDKVQYTLVMDCCTSHDFSSSELLAYYKEAFPKMRPEPNSLYYIERVLSKCTKEDIVSTLKEYSVTSEELAISLLSNVFAYMIRTLDPWDYLFFPMDWCGVSSEFFRKFLSELGIRYHCFGYMSAESSFHLKDMNPIILSLFRGEDYRAECSRFNADIKSAFVFGATCDPYTSCAFDDLRISTDIDKLSEGTRKKVLF